MRVKRSDVFFLPDLSTNILVELVGGIVTVLNAYKDHEFLESGVIASVQHCLDHLRASPPQSNANVTMDLLSTDNHVNAMQFTETTILHLETNSAGWYRLLRRVHIDLAPDEPSYYDYLNAAKRLITLGYIDHTWVTNLGGEY